MEDDPCKFALTARTGEAVETFILHSSSPSVRQTWIHEINQILENQRNFLNGTSCLCPFPTTLRTHSTPTFPCVLSVSTHPLLTLQLQTAATTKLDLRSPQLY